MSLSSLQLGFDQTAAFEPEVTFGALRS